MLSTETQPAASVENQNPKLQSYTDFRLFLKDFYEFKVRSTAHERNGYSYKVFSAAADIRSPNYLKLVIEGERNLSPKTAKKFARALGLNRIETQEFELLVNFTQALDPLERNRHLKKLSEFRMKGRIRSGEVKEDVLTRSPNWAAWVLYALADHKDAEFSIQGLKSLLQGRIKDADLQKAMEYLLKNGSLLRDPETQQVKKGLVIPPTPEDIPVEMIRRLQAELIYLGMESLLNDKAQEREFGSLSVCLTADEFEKLKFELRHLRKRIYKDTLVNREANKGDRVYQLNIQLFPITK
jgi:uncharacterized protein (TIGR02147 family)